MANIKEQFSQFRNSTPKKVQWLLLAVALIVVVILITLIFSSKKTPSLVSVGDAGKDTTLVFSPESPLNWAKTLIGTEQHQVIELMSSNNIPIKIVKIEMTDGTDGFKVSSGECTTMGQITDKTSCKMTITYNPTTVTDGEPKRQIILITWNYADMMSDATSQETEYVVILGATDVEKQVAERVPVEKPATVVTPEPVPEPVPEPEPESKPESESQPVFASDSEPEPEPEPEPEDMSVFDEDVESEPVPAPSAPSIRADIKRDIEPIVQQNVFARPERGSAAPTGGPCSEFSLPGYNGAGRQIGWIKPDNGAYYFHPFSDKTCENPTGIYNPENGIITDIEDNSKRIGTDAEHIGRGAAFSGEMPQLSARPSARPRNEDSEQIVANITEISETHLIKKTEHDEDYFMGTGSGSAVFSTQPYDRRFILRQYKPIPATIVSEVRADPSLYDAAAGNIQLPVRATVDRNVYSDNGRTIIIPTGTLMLGYVTGTLPGPYTAIGRMQIKWYQFILPNGVEFNFNGGDGDPFSADAQGRAGVPGHGSTDYLEQFVMPMLTAIVPAAVNMIAPVADKFVNQIDLDNNTVVQSGTLRSSELAKNEIITAWNQVAQKLMVDMMDNTVPPFSIAAGTRITVYSPEDLIVTCGEVPTDGSPKKDCHMTKVGKNERAPYPRNEVHIDYTDGSWTGQSRSFDLGTLCESKDNNVTWHARTDQDALEEMRKKGYSFSTVEFYCQTRNYSAKNDVKQQIIYQNQQKQFSNKYGSDNVETKITEIATNPDNEQTKAYAEEVLGLKYSEEEEGLIENPFAKPAKQDTGLKCLDGTAPDANGCCTGETYQYVEGSEVQCPNGYCCCPAAGDCFPPMQ